VFALIGTPAPLVAAEDSTADTAADESPADDAPRPNSRHGPIRKAGDYGMILNPALAGVIALSEDDPDGLRQLARGCGITILATTLLKRAFDLTWLGERPDGDRHSFPSGHTSSAMCAPAFVHSRYQDTRYTAPLLGVGAFVGYSRVWALKHHWRDVVAGTALAMVVAHHATHRRSRDEEGRRRPTPAPLALAEVWDPPEVSGAHLLLFERSEGAPAGGRELDPRVRGLGGGLALGTRASGADRAPVQMYIGLRFDGVY